MSVEKMISRSLWRIFWLRVLGDVASLPRIFLLALANFITTMAGFFGSIETSIFTLELDAARRYRAVTGVDLALASGQPSRYSGVRNGVADRRDAIFDQREEDQS